MPAWLQAWWAIGAILEGLLAWWLLNSHGWRVLLVVSAVPMGGCAGESGGGVGGGGRERGGGMWGLQRDCLHVDHLCMHPQGGKEGCGHDEAEFAPTSRAL